MLKIDVREEVSVRCFDCGTEIRKEITLSDDDREYLNTIGEGFW